MDEWTEPDGTVYRLNKDGDYDVIPSKKKKASKPKNSKVKEVKE